MGARPLTSQCNTPPANRALQYVLGVGPFESTRFAANRYSCTGCSLNGLRFAVYKLNRLHATVLPLGGLLQTFWQAGCLGLEKLLCSEAVRLNRSGVGLLAATVISTGWLGMQFARESAWRAPRRLRDSKR